MHYMNTFCRMLKNTITREYMKCLLIQTEKMMTTVYNLDKITSYTKGAFDSVIKKCTHILLDGKKMILDKNIMANLQSFNNQMTKNSMRVLAFCFKEFDEYNYEEEVEEDMTFLGLVGMIDPPRTEVYDAIKKCFKAGLKTHNDNRRPQKYCICNSKATRNCFKRK